MPFLTFLCRSSTLCFSVDETPLRNSLKKNDVSVSEVAEKNIFDRTSLLVVAAVSIRPGSQGEEEAVLLSHAEMRKREKQKQN